MPTTIVAVFAGCLPRERLAPGWRLPGVRTWPLRVAANSVVGSVLVYRVLGSTPEAGAVCTRCTAPGEFFHHTNCRMPHWVGCVFQRQGMHRIHYEHAEHRDNYGHIVLRDLLFGARRNPRARDGACGFTAGREGRVTGTLRFRDAHREGDAP
jgi:sterol desaturase/sphingolipid hydroxylase (fatty acid hydroxylase superfamily)